jgi:hypothetical protein
MSKPIFENPKVRAVRGGGVPLRALGDAADIAEAVLFLDSEGAKYISGHELVVDGGVSTSVMAHLPPRMTATRQNLILVGGIFHDFDASAEALATVLAPLGIESRIEADLDAGIASLADNPVDLLTVNALRWEMIGEKYDPYRETEAYSPPSKTRMAIEAHLHAGRRAARPAYCQHLFLGLARVGVVFGRPLGVGHQLAPATRDRDYRAGKR